MEIFPNYLYMPSYSNILMKCEICSATIKKTFLEKIEGTYIRDKKGKKKLICPECQAKLTDEEIREKIS